MLLNTKVNIRQNKMEVITLQLLRFFPITEYKDSTSVII